MFKLIPMRTTRKSDHIVSSEDIFDQFFDNFFNADALPVYNDIDSQVSSFKVDVVDNGDNFVLSAELPGISKENLRLSYDNQSLTIETKRNEQKETVVENFIRRERYAGEYKRSFYVDNIDPDTISANFENGILTITLEKKPFKDTMREININ